MTGYCYNIYTRVCVCVCVCDVCLRMVMPCAVALISTGNQVPGTYQKRSRPVPSHLVSSRLVLCRKIPCACVPVPVPFHSIPSRKHKNNTEKKKVKVKLETHKCPSPSPRVKNGTYSGEQRLKKTETEAVRFSTRAPSSVFRMGRECRGAKEVKDRQVGKKNKESHMTHNTQRTPLR